MNRGSTLASYTLAGLLSIISSSGCAMPRFCHYSPNARVYVGAGDGWCSGSVHREAEKLVKEIPVNIGVESVHYWERNMPDIRRAYKENMPINIWGFSAGGHQTKLTKQKCKEEKIFIDRITLFDPFYTSYEDIELIDLNDPNDNVGEVVVYFSTDDNDPLFWCRGSIKKFEEAAKKDKRYKPPRYIKGNHITCFKWENIGPILKKEIDDVEAHYRISERNLIKPMEDKIVHVEKIKR